MQPCLPRQSRAAPSSSSDHQVECSRGRRTRPGPSLNPPKQQQVIAPVQRRLVLVVELQVVEQLRHDLELKHARCAAPRTRRHVARRRRAARPGAQRCCAVGKAVAQALVRRARHARLERRVRRLRARCRTLNLRPMCPPSDVQPKRMRPLV
eukprot:365069-Chlamydomonas_euryale.AAC.21